MNLISLINTLTIRSTKVELNSIMTSLIEYVNKECEKIGLQKAVTSEQEVKEIKALIKEHRAEIDGIVADINYEIAKHFVETSNKDVRGLLMGELWDIKYLNTDIPQIKMYQRIEICTDMSGYICTTDKRAYSLSMFFKDELTLSTIKFLSYDLDEDDFKNIVDSANKSAVSVNDTTNISLRTKFYKKALGEGSNKKYKMILNNLVISVANAIRQDGEKLSPKTFNAICLEWIASKCVKDSRKCSFRALKSFNADTMLFDYVRSALYEHERFGQISK